MKTFSLRRFASDLFMLPPPPEDDGVELPKGISSPHVPNIENMSDEELANWEKHIEQQKLLEEARRNMAPSPPPSTSAQNAPTVAPKRNAAQIYTLCEHFFKVAST